MCLQITRGSVHRAPCQQAPLDFATSSPIVSARRVTDELGCSSWSLQLLPSTAGSRRFANYQIGQEFEGKNWLAILDCSNEPHCRAIPHFLGWHANCRQPWGDVLRNRQVVETHDRHITGNKTPASRHSESAPMA